MKKRNLILASFIILLAILTGACSTQERSIPVQEADVALAENPVPKPDAAQAEIVNPIQSTGITSYLFAPIRSTTTYLMDAEGNALQTWESAYTPGNAVYLQENGNLLRTGSVKSTKFGVGGTGGIIEEIASDGSVVWAYQYANDQVQQHHDIEQMPNGNILMIAWGLKSQADAIAAGRDPSLLSDGELWPDHVIELNPTTNTIVWEWHVWDHLVQDYDASKANYGTVSEHPGLVDINFVARKADADWNHTNSIDYNAELDQILLSVHSFSEIWIIDHDTTTKTATGTAGDLLYRWGNPQTYDAGSSGDQQFYTQHDAQWIAAGMPGAGNILVFNNGDRQTRAYSSVDEIVPPQQTESLVAAIQAPDRFQPDPHWLQGASHLPLNLPASWVLDQLQHHQRIGLDGQGERFYPQLHLVTDEAKRILWLTIGPVVGEVFAEVQVSLTHDTLAVTTRDTEAVTIHLDRIPERVRFSQYTIEADRQVRVSVVMGDSVLFTATADQAAGDLSHIWSGRE